ncbi:hypothetical protein MHLP_03160 [Candidatus Mycoplasma haematolamae str. Purdue]|uniref:Uncharacterized protein n=1 Tax=Mycoplasma haematolamae (strain Purdue) TaxID=1212765 RepID=I7C6Q5_MYCHA|nr:hypothetical protein [Candidatus Mycoplasma haematolamae]AFO52212.1 hypothetical protein MHLP_03160 [Candidatus Mycoplasma haematolamae str. Purdue]
MWSWVSQYRVPLLALLSSTPLAGLTFLASPIQVNQWSTPKINGLYTRVRVYLDNVPKEAQQQVQAAGSQAALVTQVSSSEQSSQTQQPKPAMVVELPLNRLGDISWYKYCLPEGSPLKKKGTSPVAAAASSEPKSPLCSLKWFTRRDAEAESSAESIFYILNILPKYLQVGHVFNMLSVYEEKSNFEKDPQKSTNLDANLKKVAEACKIAESSDKKKIFQELFSASQDCLMSPSFMRVKMHLKDKNSGGSTQTSSAITVASGQGTQVTESAEQKFLLDVDTLSNSVISGDIRYGLFSYSTERKLIKNQSSQDRFFSFNFKWPNVWLKLKEPSEDKANKDCYLMSMYKQALEREMKLDDVISRCIF